VITNPIAIKALEMLNVDHAGLDEMDIKILLTMIENYRGGPVGLKTISVAVGEDAGTLEEIFEPYLIQQGFMERTAQGRKVTHKAYKHLGIKPSTPQMTIHDIEG
jgi:Holliday junction DNA helicase RuvB